MIMKLPTLNDHDTAIKKVAECFTHEFAEFAAGHERLHDLMMELADEFIETNIPIVDEEASTDVAVELLMNTTIRPV
jgi:hypothetical protein